MQEARTEAKAQFFGIAEENVKYAEGMKSELEKDGHVVELVEHLVIGEELLCVKSTGMSDVNFGANGRRKITPCSLISSDHGLWVSHSRPAFSGHRVDCTVGNLVLN
jgi:hypothetical protein